MMKLLQISALFLAATAVSAKGPPPGTPNGPPAEEPATAPADDSSLEVISGGDAEETCNNAHGCDCFTCGDVVEQDDGSLNISVNHCKDGSISWICCTAVDGIDNTCDVKSCEGPKCTSVNSGDFTVNVPADARSFTINTHDGKTQGDALNVKSICGGPQGGQGGSCADDAAGITAHCLIDFDIIAQCNWPEGDAPEPEVEEPEPEPEAPAPAPEAPEPEAPAPAPEAPEPEAPAPEPEAPEPEAPAPEPEAPAPEPATEPKDAPSPTPGKASGSGDPHFKTWSGAKFDYHGECDLVLVDNPTFADGKGLRVHIRTTRVGYFSYISKVALQIDNDVLEFDNDVENFLINGVSAEDNRKHHKTMLGGFFVRRDQKALSVRLDKEGGAKIDFHTRKNGFPAIIVDGGSTDIFKGSLGLLGDWATGKRIARDGETELAGQDATDFVLEWQVRDTEPMLFTDARFPQFPTTCTPPAEMPKRLGGSSFEKEAEKACAHWKEDFEDCVFDVIATRDVLVAQEGHIVHVE